MKHVSLMILIVIILNTITFQGCIDQNNQDIKLFTTPINSLGFKSNQLPDNVVKENESFDDVATELEFSPNITISLLEIYRVEYLTIDSQPFLILEVNKLNSSEAAKDLFKIKKNDFTGSEYTVFSIDEQGDESIICQYRDIHIILFRKYNILSTLFVTMSGEIDLDKSIEYAEIILSNIESKV